MFWESFNGLERASNESDSRAGKQQMDLHKDYGRPVKKLSSLHDQKFNPNPNLLGTARV